MASVLVDRYELRERIGSGGMATVWRGFDRRLGREVAVKVLAEALASDLKFRRRFEREALHIASLSHPNILVVHDFGVDGDALFIVMELVRGRSLRQVLAGAARLPPGPVVTLATDVLAGLGHAHAAGLLHRDLKPANILVTGSGVAKVADFGIAKGSGESAELTGAGGFLGTVAYASPEQLSGGPLSPASDLYSMGCVLYQCLAGGPPFEAQSIGELVALHLTADPEPLARVAHDAPPELASAVMRALNKDPGARFPSASDMATALGADVAHGARRPPLGAASAAGSAEDEAGAATPPTRSGPTATTIDLARPRGARRLLWAALAFAVVAAGAAAAFLEVGTKSSSRPPPRPAALSSRGATVPVALATSASTAAPAATVAATTLATQAAPVPNVLSGSGDELTAPFAIQGGLTVFNCETSGSSRFVVQLVDSGGTTIDTLVNVTGSFAGSTGRKLATGGYTLKITADGDWVVAVAQPRSQPARALPWVYAGRGQTFLGPFHASSAVQLTVQHDGQSNFAVQVLGSDGSLQDRAINEVGTYLGSTVDPALHGDYYLNVEADGNWSINLMPMPAARSGSGATPPQPASRAASAG